jgi:mannosyltransferase
MAVVHTAAVRRPFLSVATRTVQIVIALTVAAAVLRMVGIGAKGFWQDEARTVLHTKLGFGGMLDEVIDTETTPPLYFVLSWPWAKVFGSGETGLRSLSALAGTVTVPVAYLAAKELVSRRAGLVTALLVAVNPLLVWYGQEARSYSLLVLLSTLSLLCFARALDAPRDRLTRAIAWWGLAAVAALATHHFALFLVLPEALWLLHKRRDARSVRVAVGVAFAVAAAVLVLASGQDTGPNVSWIGDIPLGGRVAQIPGIFLIGFESPAPLVLAPIAAACAAVGLWLAATRAARRERDGAALAGGLALMPPLGALALAAIGFDFVLYRNVIPALIPALIVLGAGFGSRRASPAAAVPALGLLCAISVGVVVATAHQPKYRKEVWREVAHALGPTSSGRAIVATPGGPAELPLAVYLPGTRRMASRGAAVREIVVVGAAYRKPGSLADPVTPRPAAPPPPPAPGFRLAGRYDGAKFALFRFRSSRPLVVRAAEIRGSRIGASDTMVLVQPR